MENIEFVPFCGVDQWKNIVQATNEKEGWILANEDFDAWSGGFGAENYNLLAAVERETKKVVGSVATAFYKSIDGSESLVTVGMFFVLPEFRGIGLGFELFKRVLDDPKFKNCNLALNGVPAMTKKYASRFGFDKYPDWQIGAFEASTKDINFERLESDASIQTIPFKEFQDRQKFIEFDAKITGGIRRDGFIQKYLGSKNAFSKVAKNAEENIVGVCNIRIGFGNNLVIGPFYADSLSIAETLLKDTLKLIPNFQSYSKLFLFPANTNKEAKAIFEKLADGKVNEHDVMYGQFTKHVVKTDTSKIYSITEYAMSFC